MQRLCALSTALSGAPLEDVIKALQDAKTLADEQGAKLWLVRIAVSLAEILIAADRVSDARPLLEDTIARFPVSGRSLQKYQLACDLLTGIQSPLKR